MPSTRIPLITSNSIQSTPSTRRRRRRPLESDSSSLELNPSTVSTFSIMRHNISRSMVMPSSALPVHQGATLPTESSSETNPLYSNKSRRVSRSRCIRSIGSYLKPYFVLRLLGLLAVGRLLSTHYYFMSLSSQRALWMINTNTAAGRLLEVVLSPASRLHEMDPAVMFVAHPTSPEWLQERRQARIQRTRPGFVDTTSLAPAGVSRTEHPVLDATTAELKRDILIDWKRLCKQANMNSGSRVLIVNLLSHPTGAAVAKLIAKQCGVYQLTGADPMLPNLRRNRIALMNIQKELIRKIPALQVTVTEPGMGLHEKNRLQPLAWLNRVRPTHILVLDPLHSPIFVESLGGLSSFEMFARQQLRHVWQDLSMTVQQLPVRLLHIASQLLGEISQTMGLASVSSWDMRIPFSFATLSLGVLSGPGITPELFPESSQPVFIDQGLRAVMMGWQRPKQIFAVNFSPPLITAEDSLETALWEDYLAHPFDVTVLSANQTVLVKTRQHLQNLGNDPVVLPCASQCQTASSLRTCSETVWDHAIGPSVAATEGCEYALFMANFSSHLADTQQYVADPSLCRVLYISRKSRLAENFKTETNGKATSNGWNLVWIDVTEKTFSANESAFLRIDPSRLFSSTVRKAMHVNTVAFASAPDQALLNIIKQIDRPEVHEGERRIRDVRPGTDLKRWKAVPAEPARRVALFGGTPLPDNRPETLPAYKEMMGNAVSQRQIGFYQQLAHWVHVNLDRPEAEIRGTVYLKFPFEWTSRYFIVHDLTLEAARELRCNWLQEHWMWNAKPSFWDTEDLSLAFVLGAMKTVERLGILSDDADPGWIPFLNEEHESHFEGQDQIYLRLMLPRED